MMDADRSVPVRVTPMIDVKDNDAVVWLMNAIANEVLAAPRTP
jgi:hypothetical protein